MASLFFTPDLISGLRQLASVILCSPASFTPACAWKPFADQAAALYPGCFLELFDHGQQSYLFKG